MKLIGLVPVRNEAWCLGLSARVALLWCDELVILDHRSADNSRQIINELFDEYFGRVSIIEWQDEAWHEMSMRQFMLESARKRGATHLAIIDADETTSANLIPAIRDTGLWSTSGDRILQLPLYNLRGSLNRYHSNGIWGQRWGSLAFADAEYLGWSGDRFHQREPTGRPLVSYRPIQQGQGGVLHLWGCSERRITAKHALYKINERLRWPNKPVQEIDRMYNLWRSPEDSAVEYPQQTEWGKPWTFSDVPASWWEPYSHLMKYLDIDAEPWQEAEVQRLVQEHGQERFAGLDLFGVA